MPPPHLISSGRFAYPPPPFGTPLKDTTDYFKVGFTLLQYIFVLCYRFIEVHTDRFIEVYIDHFLKFM